jgi:hypothetical protein
MPLCTLHKIFELKKMEKLTYVPFFFFYLCSICFGVRCFLKNIFSIFQCLVAAKIIVNKNNFQFDRKSLFNFWKTIYSFQNRKLFSKFKLFILARTFVGIRHCQALKFVNSLTLCWNPATTIGI